jgi:glycosyltransferase involved in cell wall biosynthesis
MNQVRISIVISAKNEAVNIPFLLNSIQKLIYPKDCFEIIIVDDNSTDSTLCIVESYKSQLTNLKVIKAENKKYPGKKGALALGIKNATNDYILITDADCIVNPEWLIRYSEKFKESYDFLFGKAPFYKRPGIINAISRFENIRTFLLYIIALKLHFPYSATARNFGFCKSSFYKIKGYANTIETLGGDDDLLIREAVKYKMKIGYIDNKEAAVYSETKVRFYDYLAQRSRHTKTSIYYLLAPKLFLAGWHIINLVLVFSFFAGFFYEWLFIPFIIKILSDITIVKKNESKYDYKFGYLQIIYLQIIYEFLIVINFMNALFRKDKWK